MDLVRSLADRNKKIDAATVLQKLLQQQVVQGHFHMDPAGSSHRMVELTWRERADLFSGQFGHRPHLLTLAACALADGCDRYEMGERNQLGIFNALHALVEDLEINGRRYRLTKVDTLLLDDALLAYNRLSRRFSDSATTSLEDRLAEPVLH